MSRIQVWILSLVVSCSACASSISGPPAASENVTRSTIYLVNHGWHAGIVLRQAEILDSAWPVLEDFPDAQYLEVGWGDMDFYQTPGPHMGLILKAALLPTASVLHIVGFTGPVASYFPYSEIIRIELSASAHEQLSRTIAASFARDEAGKTRSLGQGIYGDSNFYMSREVYHLFNTSNVWTARALRDAGLPITPQRVFTVEDLMSQAAKIGMVVQSTTTDSD